MSRTCKCGETNQEAFFPSQFYQCRACNIARTRAWQKAHPERVNEITRKSRAKHPERVARNYEDRRFRRYGLTRAEYEALMERQNGVCAICGSANWGPHKPHIDHDHDSGEVRGLLCANCNVMIGHAREDAEILSRAIDYLSAIRPPSGSSPEVKV